MNRANILIGLSLGVGALTFVGVRDAAACGGCFQPPRPPTQTASDITDERMLLSVSTTQSTLYDQIRYAGNPSSFAWVLPIHGTVDVGLSADVLFDSIDVLTETRIVAPSANCAPPPNCGYLSAGAAASGASASSPIDVVTVTKQENVGPYATVQLHATSSTVLETWLAQNGFVIPADVAPIIAQYVTEGFDFLAMKLLPNQGVQSMRPVRVTTPGASLSLPLRMAAVGTGAAVGITIWVVSDGRYEPQNFPFFYIDQSQLVWDWKTGSSNYTTLRARNGAALGGKGWEIESSLNLNRQLITNVILSGGQYYGNGGFGGGIAPATATMDYLAAGAPDAGPGAPPFQTAEEVRGADIAALFAGLAGSNVRVTRMRSDIAHAAMTKDFVLQASADQSEISNLRYVTQSVNLVCPAYPACTGSYNGGNVYPNATTGNVSGTPTGNVSGSQIGTTGNVSGSQPATTDAVPSAGKGGCSTSAQPIGLKGGLGAMAGAVGLMAARIVRGRRRRSSKRSCSGIESRVS